MLPDPKCPRARNRGGSARSGFPSRSTGSPPLEVSPGPPERQDSSAAGTKPAAYHPASREGDAGGVGKGWRSRKQQGNKSLRYKK